MEKGVIEPSVATTAHLDSSADFRNLSDITADDTVCLPAKLGHARDPLAQLPGLLLESSKGVQRYL